MKELLRWLSAKSKKSDGATTQQIIRHVMSEISSLGATERRSMGYIETLSKLGFITLYRLKWKTTPIAENWLQIHKGL